MTGSFDQAWRILKVLPMGMPSTGALGAAGGASGMPFSRPPMQRQQSPADAALQSLSRHSPEALQAYAKNASPLHAGMVNTMVNHPGFQEMQSQQMAPAQAPPSYSGAGSPYNANIQDPMTGAPIQQQQ